MFKIVIDMREKDLIQKIKEKQKANSKLFNIEVEVRNLELGDILIEYVGSGNKDGGEFNNDREENCTLMIERKNINDLASSITDGRYKEQSYRLFHHSVPNHNIVYLIEGKITDLNMRYARVTPAALYSSMIVLQYYKGFSVFRTMDLLESAEWIIRIADKMCREKKKGFYDGYENPYQNQEYTDVVKTRKKDNVTPENIGVFILNQIPGISHITASAIMNHFESLDSLLTSLNEDKKCLEEVTYQTQSKQTRRLNSTAKENIINYLLYKKQKVIEVK
jgi:ERCC4-type nuclease